MRKIVRFIIPKINWILYYFSNRIRANTISFNTIVSRGCQINYSIIYDYSYLGPNCLLNTVQIGRYSSIGPNVVIGGAEHSYWWYSTSHFLSKENVGGRLTVIGNDVWVGANVCIRQGISIGDGAIIGAGSIVLKDIPPYTIYAGNPAKFIKNRFQNDDFLMKTRKSKYWEFSKDEAIEILKSLDIK